MSNVKKVNAATNEVWMKKVEREEIQNSIAVEVQTHLSWVRGNC